MMTFHNGRGVNDAPAAPKPPTMTAAQFAALTDRQIVDLLADRHDLIIAVIRGNA